MNVIFNRSVRIGEVTYPASKIPVEIPEEVESGFFKVVSKDKGKGKPKKDEHANSVIHALVKAGDIIIVSGDQVDDEDETESEEQSVKPSAKAKASK